MNYIQLVQRTVRECGLSSPVPATVVNQTGELLDAVNRVADAWTEIQRSKTRWHFMWASASKDLPSGGYVFNPSVDWSLSVRAFDRNRFRIYETGGSMAEEQPLSFIPWREYVLSYGVGEYAASKPTVFTIRPDDRIVFPAPTDKEYTLRMEYWKKPQVLSVNADIPAMDEDYHMAIVWRAVQTYGGHEEAAAKWEHARNEYNRIYGDMCRTQLPDLTFGEPIGA